MTLLFAFLIGLFAGLRSLTPPPAVACAVVLGWLKLARHCLSSARMRFSWRWTVGCRWCGAGTDRRNSWLFRRLSHRARLVRSLRQPDFNIALLEDLIAIGRSLLIVSRF